MKAIKFKVFFGLIVLFYSINGYGQLTTVTINTNKDSYIDSRYATTNYGNSTILNVGTYLYRGLGPYYRRTFVEFDVSSLPANAVVYSAEIKMRRTTTVSGTNPWRTKLITSTWSETGVTASNQPSISNNAGDVSSSYSSSNDTISFDVSSMVQRMIYGQADNYGWCIQVLDETYGGTSGTTFYSSESSTFTPYLEVKYYLPLSISDVSITHESSIDAKDGEISLTVNNGSGSYSYNWIDGSKGTTISTSSSVSGIGYGWYGLHVTGTYGEELYYAFLVGTKCEEVTINFESSAEYTDNAFLYNLFYNGVDYGDNNYGDYTYLKTQRWTYSGTWMSGKSLLRFNLWMDDAFKINQADMTMYGASHSTLGGSNAAELNLVTEYWDQDLVTWNTGPSTSASIDVDIPATTSSTQNNTVDLTNFWNNWKIDNSQNYGLILQLQNFNNYYHEQRYHSPSTSTSANRPDLVFKLELTKDSYTTMTWDPDIETGEINLDIQDLCGTHTAPYKYMISHDTISDLTEMYNFINDTVFFGGLDSADFFNGTTHTNTTFSDLESNRYMVSVFDATWSKVWEEEVFVQDTITFETQSGLSISNNILAASQSNSIGSLDLYTQNDENSELSFVILSFDGEQFFGLTEFDSTVTSYSTLEHGFYLNEDTLKTIDRGILSTSYQIINTGSSLKVQNTGDSIKCLLDDVSVQSRSTSTTFTYKVGLGMQPQGSVKLAAKKMKFKFPLYFFNSTVDRFQCEGQLGELFFKVNKLSMGGPFSVTYSVEDENGNPIVQNANNSTGVDISVPITGPGIFKITFSIDGGAQQTKYVTVGYENVWEVRDAEYTQTPNTYSLLAVGHDEIDYLTARSSNVLKNTDPGWVEFSPVINNGANFLRFTTLDLNATPTGSITNEDFVAFIKLWNLRFMISYSGTSQSPGLISITPISSTSKISLRYSYTTGIAETVSIYKDNVSISTMDRGNYTIVSRFNSIKNNDGFKNVLSSYPCRTIENQHAHLKYKLDGYYHTMQNGKINFLFNQEYDAEPLSFNIYNSSDELVMTQNDFSTINTTNGDNYLTVDVSDDLHCIGPGFFYLEVINSKKERMYLRFYNDYSNCTY